MRSTTTTTTEEDKGRRFTFIEHPEDPAFIWVRLIPRKVHEVIDKKWRGKKKKGRYGNQPYYQQSTDDIRMQAYERAEYAIARIENYGLTLASQSAVELYQKAAGVTGVKVGDTVSLEGKPNTAVLHILFDFVPRSVTWVLQRVSDLDDISDEADEVKVDEENLDSGSTGSTELGQSESASSPTQSAGSAPSTTAATIHASASGN